MIPHQDSSRKGFRDPAGFSRRFPEKRRTNALSREIQRIRSRGGEILELLGRDGVLVYPGHFFDMAREAYLVPSLLCRRDQFRSGMERLIQRIRSLSDGDSSE